MLEDLLPDELALAIAICGEPDPLRDAQCLANGSKLRALVTPVSRPRAVEALRPKKNCRPALPGPHNLQYPFYGSRRLCDELEDRGQTVNRKRVQRLMGLQALYPRRRTRQPGKGHKIYPYLLRGLPIERANHVWSTDITYIPMAKGFMYLAAIIDWYSRRVVSWRVSNTLDTGFCIEALEEALQRFGAPQIFNTDQGRSLPPRTSPMCSRTTLLTMRITLTSSRFRGTRCENETRSCPLARGRALTSTAKTDAVINASLR